MYILGRITKEVLEDLNDHFYFVLYKSLNSKRKYFWVHVWFWLVWLSNGYFIGETKSNVDLMSSEISRSWKCINDMLSSNSMN